MGWRIAGPRLRPRHLSLLLPPGAALAGLALLLLACITLGHEGRRVAQVAVLALPALLWLQLPLRSRAARTARGVLAGAWVAAFVLDGAVRAYLQLRYLAAPDSTLVLAAVANTHPREMLEYARAQAPALAGMAALLLGVLAAALALVAAAGRRAPDPQPTTATATATASNAATANTAATAATRPWPRRGTRALLLLLALLCVASLASKPWRRHHPALFWPDWARSVQALQHTWQAQQGQRDALLANARASGVRHGAEGPSTVVLVLSDSVNRDNMSLYGYPRSTTPQLLALQAAEGGRMLTLRHAWSVEAGTVASLSGIFSFGTRDADDPVGRTQHILALARAAGYRVWWMSNHDDMAIEQQHAHLADEVEMINREPGRDTTQLDGELLDCLEEALAHEAPRKLIVVHLLGAHPHYRLRVPPSLAPLPASADAVEAEMVAEGRPRWLRSTRRAYDLAISYHDAVVARTLHLARQYAPAQGRGAWMYLSDHGQEVGHDISHAGHSPGTPAGYRIPALLWRNGPPFPAQAAQRPFRADWAGWTLADLLALDWPGLDARRNVLDPRYAWQPPQLAVKVQSFEQ